VDLRASRKGVLKALYLLDKDSDIIDNPNTLWNHIMNGVKKSHNSQMDVVLALWNADLII